MYAAELGGYSFVRDMELLHKMFLKYVFIVNKRTSNDIVYGEFGVYPSKINNECRESSYWVRLITGKNTELGYLMYRCLWQLDQLGIYSSPSLMYITNIFNDCGMSGVWTPQNVANSVIPCWVPWSKVQTMTELSIPWLATPRKIERTRLPSEDVLPQRCNSIQLMHHAVLILVMPLR